MLSEPPGEQCRAMMALADVWEEAEGMVACVRCHGVEPCEFCNGTDSTEAPFGNGVINCPNGYDDDGHWIGGQCRGTCTTCHGTGFVSNGNSLRAEALRLLAECGITGEEMGGGRDYAIWSIGSKSAGVRVPQRWWVRADAIGTGLSRKPLVDARLALLDAYAAADRDTREAWARETRKLAGWVECLHPSCDGYGVRDALYQGVANPDCLACHGAGIVPPAQVEATA